MEKEQVIEWIRQNPEVIEQVGQTIEQTQVVEQIGQTIEQAPVIETQESEQSAKENQSIMPGVITLLSMPQVQSIINLYLKNSGKQFQWDIVFRYGLAFTAIAIAGFLGYYDKMDSTMGVLIGSVLGYMFGRKEG